MLEHIEVQWHDHTARPSTMHSVCKSNSSSLATRWSSSSSGPSSLFCLSVLPRWPADAATDATAETSRETIMRPRSGSACVGTDGSQCTPAITTVCPSFIVHDPSADDTTPPVAVALRGRSSARPSGTRLAPET